MIAATTMVPQSIEPKPDRVSTPSANDVASSSNAIKLVSVLVWPFVFLFVALFAIQMSHKHAVVEKIHLSPKELEISFYLLKAEQSAGPDGKTASPTPDVSAIQRQAQQVSSVSLAGKEVLWVDDNPGNNAYERNALSALGVNFTTATSTSEALDDLSKQHFSLIISDFARSDDPQGGYTLLRISRNHPDPLPFIIYSSSANPGFDEDSKKLGAIGETNSPRALFDMVINALKSPGRP